jgi:hypothetical protein
MAILNGRQCQNGGIKAQKGRLCTLFGVKTAESSRRYAANFVLQFKARVKGYAEYKHKSIKGYTRKKLCRVHKRLCNVQA